MEKKYIFKKGKWEQEDFFYAYSPVCKAYKEFIQEEDCISNSGDVAQGEYDYISMITKEKYKKGVRISAKCSFDSYGAPLIVLTDDVSENKDGKWQYGLHFEIVTYEGGCNVWHIVPAPENVQRPIKTTAIKKVNFEIEEKSLIDLAVVVGERELSIEINGQKLTAVHEELPETFHVGFTACEGINHFYEFSIER